MKYQNLSIFHIKKNCHDEFLLGFRNWVTLFLITFDDGHLDDTVKNRTTVEVAALNAFQPIHWSNSRGSVLNSIQYVRSKWGLSNWQVFNADQRGSSQEATMKNVNFLSTERNRGSKFQFYSTKNYYESLLKSAIVSALFTLFYIL